MEKDLSGGTEGALKVCDFITTDEDGNYTGVIDFNDPSWDTLVNEISLEEAIAFIEGNGDGLQSISSVGIQATEEMTDGRLCI